MKQDKKIGTSAKELVLLFYEKTGLRYTNKDIMIAVKNAKNLLNVGYTYDEIKNTIEYCVENQPEKGIYSFGFIVHEINKVTTMLKAKNKQIKNTQALDKNKFSNYGLQEVSNKDKIKPRETKIDTSIFD
jgi:hypothetical protein